jgi:hypothetical protein
VHSTKLDSPSPHFSLQHLVWPPLHFAQLPTSESLQVELLYMHNTLVHPPKMGIPTGFLQTMLHHASGQVQNSSVGEAWLAFSKCELCMAAYSRALKVRGAGGLPSAQCPVPVALPGTCRSFHRPAPCHCAPPHRPWRRRGELAQRAAGALGAACGVASAPPPPQVRTARLPAATFKVAASHFLDSAELHRWLAEFKDGILADAGVRVRVVYVWGGGVGVGLLAGRGGAAGGAGLLAGRGCWQGGAAGGADS